MKLRSLRLVIATISVIATASMIISAILLHIGAVIAFGSFAAVSIIVLITATTVVKGETVPKDGASSKELSLELEDKITMISSESEVEESDLRDLVRIAVKLGENLH
ncbi:MULTISPECIES: hypothetical protein [Acidithrix]|uniref:Uncharacterized protein n=1 Tax=Acidithrix ferrooxidans TaxID=1280514 RepID=A0A0D8HGA3_9ACTN|nr:MULTISPECIES: hypothetical protein [Acidithrix]KJF17010.1 hypothetical protein AXFE_21450 [Acidithrix ferrooxidans]CAG4931325.1 unnamed protein product [Acidithrix sp. C25]